MVRTFSKAKSLGGEPVLFEVAGGGISFVVDWKRSGAFTKCVGTHADYDTINALAVNLF